MELVTAELSRDQMLTGLALIVTILQRIGTEQLILELGWGSNIEVDRLWKDLPIRTTDIESFLTASEAQGVYTLGNADLFIMDHARSFTFLFCHESDIHLTTNNSELLKIVLQSWMAAGFNVFGRTKNNKLIPLPVSSIDGFASEECN